MIWQRYYFKELSLIFTFVLFISYILYALIDYSSHTILLPQGKDSLLYILLYYLYQFSTHAEILIPLALLLATLKVLLHAQSHREILALLASGISCKKISHPFLLFGLFVMALCYLNFEYIQPKVYLQLIKLEKQPDGARVHALRLEDLSLIIYQSYDPIKKEFFDLFWKKNNNEFYKIERLTLTDDSPLGSNVTYFTREINSEKLLRVQHDRRCNLKALHFPENLHTLICPPKWQSLSQLGKKIPLSHLQHLNEIESAILTHFCYKILMPLSALIVVIIPLCSSFHFSRRSFPLLIYGVALFGYITLFTLLGASVILGENQIFHPLLVMCGPMGILISYLGYKYGQL